MMRALKLDDPQVVARARRLSARCGCQNERLHAPVARAQLEIAAEREEKS